MPNDSFHNSVCPFIGLVNDPTIMLSEVTDAHRCYAPLLPRKPDEDEQQQYCLSPQHAQCKFFVAANTSGRGSTPVVPAGNRIGITERRVSHRYGWMAMALVSALIVVAASAVVINALVPPGTSDTESDPGSLESALTIVDESAGASALAQPAIATVTLPVPDAGINEPVPPQSEGITDSQGSNNSDLILVPTSTPVPVNGTGDARASGENQASRTITPISGGELFTLRPKGNDVGWWRTNDPRRNYIGDSYLYAGNRDGDSYISAMRFELDDVPRGAIIETAELYLTGLRQDQLVTDGGGSWLVQMLPESSLEEMAAADFLTAYSAPATIFLGSVSSNDVAEGRTNVWRLDAGALEWLKNQRFEDARSVYVRIQASPQINSENLFAWDSGSGPETQGNAPQLLLNVGPAPVTPPPLFTKPVVVATLTPVPENVLTIVAQAAIATQVAETIGTYTPVPFGVVTPTPLPANLATVQSISSAGGLPAIVRHTPTPSSPAAATLDAQIATAVAKTTGTYTPVPTGYVTPVLILPSPPAQNVATEAARAAVATDAALRGIPTAAIPWNGELAEYVIATATPGNVLTAAAESVFATSEASINGTPTPLAPNAVVITLVPTLAPPTSTPLPLIMAPTITPIPPTPTAVPDALPTDIGLEGKIVFLSDRAGGAMPHLLDPATGEVQLITQEWIYDRAREVLPNSPNGEQIALVEPDIGRVDQQGNHILQIVLFSVDFGNKVQITACRSNCYDPAWSPAGDRVAYVGVDDTDEEIYVVSTDGTTTTQLTVTGWPSDKHPTWSPDGTKIAFYSNRTGRNQLWIMNADGTDQKNISNNEYNDTNPIWIR